MDNNQGFSRREELRGLFIFGVLASLLAGREYYTAVKIPFGTVEIDAVFFADLILLLWGTYAFFMALSISDDVLPNFLRPLSKIFATVASVFLMMGIIIITYLGVLFFLIGNLTKLHIPIIPLIPYLFFETYKNRNLFKISIKPKIDLNLDKIFRKISATGFLLTYVTIITSIFSRYDLAQNHLPILIVFSFGFMLANVILITDRND